MKKKKKLNNTMKQEVKNWLPANLVKILVDAILKYRQ